MSEKLGKMAELLIAGQVDEVVNLTRQTLDDGVGPGDFFAVYRMQQGHRLMLGEALVVRAERDTATVKITHSFREIYTGDRVDLK